MKFLKLLLLPFLLPLMGATAWKDSAGWVYVDGLPVSERVTVHFLNEEKTTSRAANSCGWFQWTRSPGPISIDGVPVAVESTRDRCRNGVVVSSNLGPIAVVRGFQKNSRHVIASTGSVRTSLRTTGKCGLLRLNSATYDLSEFAITSTAGSFQWAIASLPVLLPHQCKIYKDGVSLMLIPEGQTHGPGVAGVAYTPPSAPGGGTLPPPVVTTPQIPAGDNACYDRRNLAPYNLVTGIYTGGSVVLYTRGTSGPVTDINNQSRGSLVDGKATISIIPALNNNFFSDQNNGVVYILPLDYIGNNHIIAPNIFKLTPECIP